jgi:hypothetical protein
MRTCLDCKQTKPPDEFDAPNGLPYAHERCQDCRAARRRGEDPMVAGPAAEAIMRTRGKAGPKPKPNFPPGMRICTDCGGTKPIAEFVPISRTEAGFYGPCRPCQTRRAWETLHPGRSYEEHLAAKAVAESSPKAKQPPTARMCTDCKLTKEISEFLPIQACRQGRYGRCRVCRARRARERYQADPTERVKQKARVRRNTIRRRLAGR